MIENLRLLLLLVFVSCVEILFQIKEYMQFAKMWERSRYNDVEDGKMESKASRETKVKQMDISVEEAYNQ